mgnify:CR=1 FL=1
MGTWARHEVGGVGIDLATAHESVESLLQIALELSGQDSQESDLGADRGMAVHFANSYTISLAARDHEYAGLLNRPESLVMADGRPVVWAAARIYGATEALAGTWQQVCGPETMPAILTLSQGTALSHYFLGGSEATLAALVAEVGRRFPDAQVAGWESPPFRALTEVEHEAQVSRIRDSGASLVWVGLGTPKQDWEVSRLADRLPVLAVAVGAAFDFIAGTKPEAPAWVRRSGLEWGFRWASEPRRLTRRYAIGNSQFLWAVAKSARRERRR